MKRLVSCLALVLVVASILTARSAAPLSPPRVAPGAAPASLAQGPPATSRTPTLPVPGATHGDLSRTPPDTFEKYCFECHGTYKPEGNLSLETLLQQSTKSSVGLRPVEWEKVADMLESGMMPPQEATLFPSDAERTAAASWIRGSLKAYETAHAGEPGHVTVRRLTSAEYAYAIQDLTGVGVKVGIDASSDSVGGEGFANFGDVQFVQDTSIERYLDAAKVVADHALIGSGPLSFGPDAGMTGLEIAALARINALYETKGFRVVSGEGGFPYGLERYGRALYVAWYYRHRVALGDPGATLRGLAQKEGITGRFAEHVWSVVNRPTTRYPVRETVEAWKAIRPPAGDARAAMTLARAACDDLSKALTTWPSWFFARGDLAAGGAGDESPLVFDDTSLKVQPQRAYTYALGARGLRGRGPAPAAPSPTTVVLAFTDLNPSPGRKPVVIWRNARVITRAVPAPAARGGGAPAGPAAAGRGPAPVVASQPLREVLPADIVRTLAFGTSPDGTPMGPDDFATTGTVSFLVPAPAAAAGATELQMTAELGADVNAVVRLMVTDKPEGSSRDAAQRVLLGTPGSAGYKAFRAAMSEYVALLPPNSHGEANPADKDPVPLPFDSTFNTPEHDAFVMKVKYQRNDAFFTANLVDGAERTALDQAWNDLLGSWPYHDAYLGMLAEHYAVDLKGLRIKDMTAPVIATLPVPMQPFVKDLRTSYDAVTRAREAAQPGHVTDVLAFASRAWRRPLSAREQASLRAFYQRSRQVTGLDHEGALRALLARVLMSPAFLYRVETVASGPEKPLDGWEMASRLSFFLWSSIPDDELRRAAAAGELARPAGLTTQVKRMTADPKARRLATEFFGQWLGFYHFDEFRGVDTQRFPEFTDIVKQSMYEEAVSTFEYIVRQGRPIRDVLYADYTFLNKPLAEFYGITAGVTSDTVQFVPGAAAFDRGGALRLGAVLTTTSAPLRTSPVKRGDWVLRRLLGTPTPPPPPDAGSIPADPNGFNGLTLRERLTQHKRNATCANCHLRIDPLGFPLEGFDHLGRTRDRYADGTAVDTTGEFADKTTIVGTGGLLQYLQTRDTLVMTTLSRKMLGYALGRTVLASDRPLVNEMVAAGGQASFADLALRIVASRQFRFRAGDVSQTASQDAGSPSRGGEAPPARVSPRPSASLQRAGIQ